MRVSTGRQSDRPTFRRKELESLTGGIDFVNDQVELAVEQIIYAISRRGSFVWMRNNNVEAALAKSTSGGGGGGGIVANSVSVTDSVSVATLADGESKKSNRRGDVNVGKTSVDRPIDSSLWAYPLRSWPLPMGPSEILAAPYGP